MAELDRSDPERKEQVGFQPFKRAAHGKNIGDEQIANIDRRNGYLTLPRFSGLPLLPESGGTRRCLTGHVEFSGDAD